MGELMREFAIAACMIAHGPPAPEERIMAKGQVKKNKETRKPKAEKAPKTNASQPSLKSGGIKGLENMKNG